MLLLLMLLMLMLGEMYKLKRLLPVSARLQVFQSLEIWSNSSKTREQKIQENDFVFFMKENLFGIRIFGIKADLTISNKKGEQNSVHFPDNGANS